MPLPSTVEPSTDDPPTEKASMVDGADVGLKALSQIQRPSAARRRVRVKYPARSSSRRKRRARSRPTCRERDLSKWGSALARICQPSGLASSHAAKPRVSRPRRASLIKEVGTASQHPALLSTRSMECSVVVPLEWRDRAVMRGLVVKY